MAAKKSTKREFDWRTYSKPSRLLTFEQEEALLGGVLRPLLDLAHNDATINFEIRARQANLYYRGVQIVRITGAEAPFSASIDTTLRVPRAERPGAEALETWPLTTPDEVSACLVEIASLRAGLDAFAQTEPLTARDLLMQFAAANRIDAETAEIVVVDVEYQYGRRKFDFVAIRRAVSVGGAGAFTTPRLVIGEVYTGHRMPGATSGLTSFGAEAAEFVHALSGEHLMRAGAEIGELVLQRERLGLSPETPFARITDGLPELLTVFVRPDFATTAYDAPIAELHDRAVIRHFPADLMRFSAAGDARLESADKSLTLGEDDVLTYRAFKGMRKRLQG
jgi:hypothetical protein